MGRHSAHALTAVAYFALVGLLAGCSSAASENSLAAADPSATSSSSASPMFSEGSTFGEPSGLWDIPRDVQVAYFTAICTAPATKLGYAGTYDGATGKCRTPNGMETDVDFVVRGLLASDAEQMRQSTQFMVTEVEVPVPGCPTPEEYSTVVDLTVTNDCVIAAMKALTTYLSD